MNLHDVEQGSDDWRELRLGIPTASQFDRIISPVKGQFSAGAKAYAAELIAERMTGGPEDVKPTFSADIARGHEMEPRARALYEYTTGLTLMRGKDNFHWRGFITSADGKAGCSPDGLVVNSEGEVVGGLECKAPNLTNHLLWLNDGGLPNEHKCQVHASMAVTGLPWWDFFSFNASVPDTPHLVRVLRDDFTDKVIKSLGQFHELMAEMFAKLRPL